MATAESKPVLVMCNYVRHIVRTFIRYIYLSDSKIVQFFSLYISIIITD